MRHTFWVMALCLQMLGPYSWYCSRLLQMLAKPYWEPNTEPPNHTAYLCTIF